MMAKQDSHSPGSGFTAGERARRVGRLTGTVFSGTVLVIGNLATLFCTVVAWLMMPSGPGDSNHIEGAWFTAFAGMILALITALVTLVAVKTGWLGKWWFIAPMVLFVVTTARWVYIDAVYPEPRDRYGSGQVAMKTSYLE